MAVVAGIPGVAVVAVPGFMGQAFGSASLASVAHITQVGDGDEKSEDAKSEGGKSDGGKANDGPKKHDDPKEQNGKKDDANRNGEEGGPPPTAEGVAVGCDPNELIVAIQRVNADGGGAVRLAKDCTYTLTASQDDAGLPAVTVPLVVVGNNATITRAANGAAFRFFTVAGGGDLRLINATLTGGLDQTGVGGGALLVQTGAAATLIDVVLENNVTTTLGGAIRNLGSLKISRSKLLSNAATGTGNGGALSSTDGVVSIEDAKFEHNVAGDWGGAITSGDALLTVKNSSFEHNEAGDGGGAITATRLTTIIHSTFRNNNTAGVGGALNLGLGQPGPFTIRDSRIEGNSAGSAGGVNAGGTVIIEDTKITKNLARDRVGGIEGLGDLVLRRSEISGNRSLNIFGGISAADGGKVRLIDSKVTNNSATSGQGGATEALTGDLDLDEKSVVIGNRPSNCLGSLGEVTGCFA